MEEIEKIIKRKEKEKEKMRKGPRGNFSAQARKEPTAQLCVEPELVRLLSLTPRPQAPVAFYLRPGVQDEPDSLCTVHRCPSRETLAPSSSNLTFI
jgi:hypothetical protein